MHHAALGADLPLVPDLAGLLVTGEVRHLGKGRLLPPPVHDEEVGRYCGRESCPLGSRIDVSLIRLNSGTQLTVNLYFISFISSRVFTFLYFLYCRYCCAPEAPVVPNVNAHQSYRMRRRSGDFTAGRPPILSDRHPHLPLSLLPGFFLFFHERKKRKMGRATGERRSLSSLRLFTEVLPWQLRHSPDYLGALSLILHQDTHL